jgi:hypothetical protein
MKSINRRDFLKSTSGILALAAMDLAGGRSASAQQQPSTQPTGEWLNVAVVGLGMKSGSHLRAFSAAKNCRITYVCDPDTATAKAAIDAARNSNGGTEPQFVQDMRRIMDDKSVDVVTIVTPNHWHSLAAVWAMQAGKDVYVEKPLSHNLREGRRVVEAATRTKRICEVGTQMRSNPALLDSMAYIHSGALGKVKIGRALCYKPRVSIGHVDAPVQPPSTVDYNLWCGPAPDQVSLRLALAVGLRQWRYRKSGPARDRYRAVGHGRQDAAAFGHERRWALRIYRRRPDRQHPDR